MSKRKKIVLAVVLAPLLLALALYIVAYVTAFSPPPDKQEEVICSGDAPTLKAGQELKVMSWNVQYMAGKDYVFFYDILDESGPDERPSPEAITKTLADVARVIKEEDPDIVLLQELDDGAKRTDGEDQLARLLTQLPESYRCQASSFYWKAPFVPHPRVMGAVGLKMSTLSKYKMSKAIRRKLPMLEQDPVTDLFYIRRAILETQHPVEGLEKPLSAMNTHFDAFAQGTNVMEQQVERSKSILLERSRAGHPWVLGGDLNLIPPGDSYKKLGKNQKAYFNTKSELEPFFDHFVMTPSPELVDGPEREKWLTHFPNDPEVKKPDRTIDYIALPKGTPLLEARVRQGDTWTMSDHLPVMVRYQLPVAKK